MTGQPTSLKYVYAEWLSSLNFNMFAHLTWKHPISMKGAKRHVERFLKATGGFGAFGFERGHLSDLLHCHGVCNLRTDVTTAWRWWFRNYGRCLFEPLDPKLKGSLYVAKYAVKDECLEFLGDWRKINELRLDI